MFQIIDKMVGETPLAALERFRAGKILADSGDTKSLLGEYSWKDVPLTYAGRLDPMAEGKLLILIGEECKEKEKYLGLDKEYEVAIILGLETDTYDALGIVSDVQNSQVSSAGRRGGSVQGESKSIPKSWAVSCKIDGKAISIGDELVDQKWLQNYVGKFDQPYPPYSSKTVNGKQLHELARSHDLPSSEEMPTKEVEIYSIDLLSVGTVGADRLLVEMSRKIDLVKGDFRQEEIKKRWRESLTKSSSNIEVEGRRTKAGPVENHADEGSPISSTQNTNQLNESELPLLIIRVKCSSGTYMRSLAHRIGHDRGVGAFAMGINRTKIGKF